MPDPPRLLIHAGVGNLGPDSDLAQIEDEVRAALDDALAVGERLLKAGSESLTAVMQSVVMLEDSPLFNAGRGSVLTRRGTVEMDAIVVDGTRRRGGAVACVRTVRNPVRAARAVLDDGRADLLCGEGADAFAASAGCATEKQAYFVTDYWRRRWGATQGEATTLDHSARGSSPKHGTVGAVAVDTKGGLAAATSTGGLLNKLPGRIGDSAFYGAGAFADDAVAVSCSGTGEHIIRVLAAHRVAALVDNGLALKEAAREVLRTIDAIGGEAGMIAVDSLGECAIVFNTTHMLRGWIDRDGERKTALDRPGAENDGP